LSKEELMRKFEENIAYLQRNVPPDDIYIFTEHTFLAALFFLNKWSQYESIKEACKHDETTRTWVQNILGLYRLRDMKQDVKIDMDIEGANTCD